MYNSFMNGYNPGYGTGYNQNNYGNYGMMQSQIPAQSIAQASPQSMQTGQGYNYPSNAQNGVRVFQVITAPQEQNPVTPMYDPKPDIKNIYSEIENIKKELGIKDAQQKV